MSRMIALIAFALLASTVSAQTSNLSFYSDSNNCTSAGAAVVNATVPTTNTCSLINTTTVQNTYVKAVCNSTTGIVSVTLFSQDALCNATSASLTASSAQCNQIQGLGSVSIQNCTIVSPATPTPAANSTTPTPAANSTTPTPTPAGNTTNAPTVKPGSASQQAGLSMIAAVAVMVIAML